MKKCNKCEIEKSLDEFHRGGKKKDGSRYIQSSCKECSREYGREWRRGNQATAFKKKICDQCGKMRREASYSENKDFCMDCEFGEGFINRRSNQDHMKRKNSDPEYLKKVRLKYNFNMTVEQYDKMLENQDFRCAACGRHQENLSKALAVDHDHLCCPGSKSCGECVRALLCSDCNLIEGMVKDDPARLLRLAKYLMQDSTT